MQNLTTGRLLLRTVSINDAAFILRLVNDPQWLTYIGDKGIHTQQDAIDYIKNGPQKMYQEHGVGLLVVESLSGDLMGLCGLLKRPELTEPDLGFAFLPNYRHQGFAYEAAHSVLEDAFGRKKMTKILAITSVENDRSIGLLKKLGFSHKETLQLTGYEGLTHLYEIGIISNGTC
ncbi:GNAT family N-acetyltransferase [Paraglaciecola sp.]|uniref:GNAT family N-acetyltransferase n=1 Tax=Paraglaciecola sp. TaxID=1920173 RepID=UPI003EF6139B